MIPVMSARFPLMPPSPCSRSHSTVCGDPLGHAHLRLPPQQLARLLDRRVAPGRVDRLGRRLGRELELLRVAAAGLPAQPGELGDRGLLAPGDVERLALAGRRAHGADEAVGDVVEPGEGARLLAAAVDRHRAQAVERLADQVGDDRVVGAAGAVGVERAADRVAEAVLRGRRAAVHLAGQLREPVGRLRRRALPGVLLGGREHRRALVDGAGARRRRSAPRPRRAPRARPRSTARC